MQKELDRLKYEIYKKSWLSDYLTFKQFRENQKVAKTFWELQKIKNQKGLEKKKKIIINNELWNSKE